MKKLTIIAFCMFYSISYGSLLTAKNPTLQDFYITNRTSSPINVTIEASYKAINGKSYDQQATMSIAPSTKSKFTYNRNKYIIKNRIIYAGGLEQITINGKNYITTVGNDGNQYFENAEQPAGFSYNSISIYPNDRIAYDVASLKLS